ncbi:MAG TPA: flagellar protein FlgN [Bdellovibrionales bacterium]|nr:flagellar protein FlgN [Bdellovibrionales bacterium]
MGENKSTTELVASLVNVLEEQIKVYRHLLEVVRKEKEILIAANLDELNENNRVKEAMLLKIRALESARLTGAVEVYNALGLTGENPRLLEIARYVSDAEAEKLRTVHSVLELLLRRVQEYNRQNETLVQSALSNITGAMNAIRGTLQEKPTYQKKGEVEGVSSSGQLVSREA